MAKKDSTSKKVKKAAEPMAKYSKRFFFPLPHRFVDNPRKYNETYDDFVGPIWENVAAILKKENGYSNLIRMGERLDERLESTTMEYQRARKTFNNYKMAHGLFDYEARHYGPEKSLRESLGHIELKNSKPEWWTWKVVYLDDEPIEDLEATVHYYSPLITDHFRNSLDAENFPDYMVSIEGKKTWKEITREANNYRKLYEEKKESLGGLADAIKIRLQVIKAVLSEYDLLGEIPDYKPLDIYFYQKQLADEEVLRITKTCLLLYKASPKSFKHTEDLFSETIEELGLEIETSRIREMLGNALLYNKSSKRGRTTKSKERPKLLEFIAILEEFWAKFEASD